MCASSHVTFFFHRKHPDHREEMGTVLDIKIKRANKVYREGVR